MSSESLLQKLGLKQVVMKDATHSFTNMKKHPTFAVRKIPNVADHWS